MCEEQLVTFIDGGSSCSLISMELLPWLRNHNVDIHENSSQINLLAGRVLCKFKAKILIKFHGQEYVQEFLLVKDPAKPILLGRDFLNKCGISMHYKRGGYALPGADALIIPFERIPFENLFRQKILSEEHFHDNNSNSIKNSTVNEFSSPEEVLAAWAVEEDFDTYKPTQDKIPENPLFDELPDFLAAPTYLTENEKGKLRELLSNYKDMFTSRPGLCKLFQHKIEIGDNSPVTAHLRPMSIGQRKLFDVAFDELLEQGVIEPAGNSPFSSQAFTVPKPDGSSRFIVQFQPLNKITKLDKYPIPRMDDLLSFLGGFKYITVFDLSKGFFQIEMYHPHKERTAFISHRGFYQFKRLPMGCCNSPATFMRTVDAVLGDLKYVCCLGYFDDIIIFSNSFEEHLIHLQLVLDKIRKAGFTIHPKKVQLCRTKLKFLGFIIEEGKCYPDPSKLSCVHNYPRPRTPRQIKKFLGLIGFYRRFIPDLAGHSKPLLKLLKKDVKFVWSTECQQSFDTLKNSLTDVTKVHLPDLKAPFIISCDGSSFGLGAVLSQEKDGIRYPIWFASKAVNPPLSNQGSSVLELAAVNWAVRKFAHFIEYSKFTLETDHSAILWLQKMKDPSGKLARWLFELQHLDYEVKHRPGTSSIMKVPDALSRINENFFLNLDESFCRSLIREEQLKEDLMIQVRTFLINNVCEDEIDTARENRIETLARRTYITEDEILMRYVGPRNKPWEAEEQYWRIWLPQSLVQRALIIFHDSNTSGHLGIRKTYLRMEIRFFWDRMRADIINYIKKCPRCQEIKSKIIPIVPASSYNPDKPWDLVFVDLMGPYPKSSKQNCFLLVVICGFSKYVELFALRTATTQKVVDCLWEVCCRWGVFRTLVSDNGTQFTSNLYQKWCENLDIRTFHISAYHAQANSCERMNRSVKTCIMSYISKCRDWDKNLNEIAFAIRTAVSDSSQFSPAYLCTGREFRHPFDNKLNINVNTGLNPEQLEERISIIQNFARENIAESKEKSARIYNLKAKSRVFDIGQKVMYRSHYLSNKEQGFSAKLAPKWEGPLEIIFKVSRCAYDLKHIATGQLVNKVHINDLAEFHD